MPATNDPILLREPFLGIIYNNASDSLTKYLQNPLPGGLYVIEVYKGSPLHKAGIQRDDMIYEVDGHSIDIYGELNVSWGLEDKISIMDYVARLHEGDDVHIVYYRKGVRQETVVKFTQSALAPVRLIFPEFEKLDYEALGGLIITPLTLNHIVMMAQFAPELMQYADFKKQLEPILLVTHIQVNSPAFRSRTINKGSLLTEVNGKPVKTLEEFRAAALQSIQTGFLTLRTTESVFMALSLSDIIKSEEKLAATYFYPLSATYKELARLVQQKQDA